MKTFPFYRTICWHIYATGVPIQINVFADKDEAENFWQTKELPRNFKISLEEIDTKTGFYVHLQERANPGQMKLC